MPSPATSSRREPLVPCLSPNAAIKVIGLGGVGAITVRYLALFLASLSRSVRLVLIDGDSFEPSNASRMIFGDCGNKATVTREELLPRFRESALAISAIPEFVTEENISRLIHPGDIVILAVDNHATRKMVNDYCRGLEGICLISGGNDGVEDGGDGQVRRGTFGNVQIYRREDGRDLSPALDRYHPEIGAPADHHPAELSCTELVASVPQILFANLTVAAAVLNTFYLHCCGVLPYSEVVFDIAEGRMRPVDFPLGPSAEK